MIGSYFKQSVPENLTCVEAGHINVYSKVNKCDKHHKQCDK